MKTRVVFPDGSSRALTWTNRHPNQSSNAGVILFRHSSTVLSGDEFRALVASGGWIETTHPERVRRALNLAVNAPGLVEMEKEA